MQWTGINDLREMFLKFFEEKNHTILASAPLVPKDDASLLLINSGMAPLKRYFTGLETIPGNRAASCQKCIRTPDIDNVGMTSRHGTFFEMLGNFSFGDYFKEEATEWAWEFFTEVLEIPADRLYPSVYEEDDEAFEIWTKNRGIPPERIVRLGKEDNFWEHGTGPCGPCSEIYYDRGEKYGCGKTGCFAGCECDRYVEIWNLVFTQYDSDGMGNYAPLPKPNIDTGMGLERLACVIQGVDNIFEIDTVKDIISHVAEIAGVDYKKDEKTDISLRIIADHIRSTVFMVGDGVVPSNEGRGYVLRRLLRRAARHGLMLGIHGDFLYKVCDTVFALNKTAYPELTEKADYIRKVVEVEEGRFSKTIEQGMELLLEVMKEVTGKHKGHDTPIIPGDQIFKLYDTFGFPFDLTVEIAKERGFRVDEDGFLSFMHKQRETARAARENQAIASWEEDALSGSSFTETFTGYTELTSKTKVVSLVIDGELTDEVCEGGEAIIFVEETPFYAESGGQIGDTGKIQVGKSIFKVTDCRRSPTGHIMHIGKMVSGFIPVGDQAVLTVDKRRRHAIMRNHTAAHLLQTALRQVLGSHVYQSGSYVSDKVCRFDFTHFSSCTPAQLAETEAIVNSLIMEALPVQWMEMPMDEAKKLGAIALFGDKYGDIVRVVKIGDKSVELCGGTHMGNTSQLGLFKITSETSVAAGVRRIEAITGQGVLDLIGSREAILTNLSAALKTSPTELEGRVSAMQVQIKNLQRELEVMSGKMMEDSLSDLDSSIEPLGNLRFIAASLGDATIDGLKSAADKMKDKYADIIGVFTVVSQEKGSLLVFAGKDAVKSGIHAGKLVKEIAAVTGGGGGGRPDNAMGGMGDPAKAGEALKAAKEIVKKALLIEDMHNRT